MPDIKNTFLKAKMNKDLDDRLVPSGEYRDAQNLQISRSEGSDVGEFENIKGTNLEARLYTGYDDGSVAPNLDLGYNAQVIGSFSDDTNSTLYFMSTAWEGVGICPRDITVYSTAVVAGATTIQLDDALGNLLDPQVLGIEIGMLVQDPTGVYGDPDPLVIEVTATNITISQGITLGIGDEIVIGWANMIHSWDTSNSVLTLLVRGAFLNFNKNFPIHGINKMEELLFWTDNNNQPRRINITQANPANIYWPQYYTNEDQISVAKYYPFETPLVFDRTIQLCNSGIIATAPLLGYILTMNDPTGIESGDLVTGLTDQTDEELWEVINITGNDVTIYNNFLEQPLNPVATLNLSFSRPTMTNESNKLADNGFVTTLDSLGAGVITGGSVVQLVYNFDNATTGGPQPTPVPGDLITSDDLNISISDDIKIQSIDTITPGIPGIIIITLTKDITVVTGTEELRVSANPSYDSLFKGDPDLIEEKFVRFSYRFKYVDNEYSLSAPFTQICYIPKQYGFFGMGPNPTEQDMIDAYTSTVLAWFENRIDNIGLQIPFPLGGTDIATATTSLINDYQIKEIDILYKESESLITRIVDTIPVSNAASFTDYVKAIPSGAGGSTTEFYFTYDYKSIKPYKTLPQSQTTRVYDNVPVKALGQELIANRVVYGNYLEGHTPPISMDYGVFRADKSINYDNYIQYPNHTLKQNRNYQVGWILGDRYGRQSSVILSVNDDVPNVDGSTIYVPYKLWEEVSDIPGTLGGNDVSTYEWLGSVLRLRLNNGITPVVSSPITGEPGLYKAYEDTGADRITLINPGTGYVLGICDAVYDEPIVGEGPGLGTGLEVEITSETGGVITGIRIVTPGTGFVDGQLLLVKCGGTDAIIQVTVYPPNLLGWLSYKIAIKQQEQEYYNVYLPGFIAGYPVIEQTAAGKLALTAVFSDNINKLPRDLQEVGPLDTEFAASVNLYGRVNNPDINNLNGGAGVGPYWSLRDTAWNCQYFPGRFKDEVITVAPVGTGGLEVANVPFTVGATSGGTAIQGAYSNTSSINEAITVPQVAWGEPGALSSVFNIDQNPLSGVLTVGVQESQPNLNPDILATLGARVSEFSLPASPEILCMTPYLSISETEPVETNLELFYETSTCGNFVTLNDEVRLSFTGVDAVTETTGDFYESDIIGASAVNGFSFVDADGTVQPSAVPEITSIVDNNSNSYPVDPANPACPFVLDDLGGGIWNLELNILPVDFNITPSMPPVPPPNAIRNYTISYLVSLPTIDGPLLTTLSNAQIVDLLNYRPNVTGFEESAATTNPGNIAAPGDTINVTNPPAITTVFGDFKGDNGSTSGAQTNLTWELGKTVIPDYGEIWSVDCTTGALSWDSTVPLQVPPKPDTLYEFFVAPKDCATCVPAAACCPVTTTDSLTGAGTFKIQFGTPSTPRAICSGGDGYPFVCRQTPTNVSSLDYMAATPAPINQDPYTVPSGIVWSGACVATGYYTGGSSGWYAGTAGTGGLANGGGNTTPNAGANPGHPAEFYFGGTTGYNNAVTTGTQAYFTATPAYATYVAANSGGGIVGEDPWGTGNPYSAGLAFYNVAQRTTYNPAICPAPIPPAINSAALDKGTLAINIKLLRVGATAVDNATTDYTIIHRPPSGVWQPAVPSAIANGDPADSPTSPGVAIPATTTLTTAAAGSTINCFLYYFDEPGEYAVRNNGITGLGATTEPQCHAFQVDFWDAHEGASASGLIGGLCANCTGS
tara:strand:- start:13776 stop:18989 length:5214 start_codon:yes stop_codon:yes gene_type:complete